MKRSVYTLLFTFVLFSCTSEDISMNNNETVLDYSPLQTGNYWVYDWYQIDQKGNENSFNNKRDSIIIEKDTIINSKTYFIQSANFLGSPNRIKEILFDSINSIFEYPSRKLKFSIDTLQVLTKRSGPIENPTSTEYYIFKAELNEVIVPAGKFQAANFQGRVEPQKENSGSETRYVDNFYSKSVGLVKIVTFLDKAPGTLESRLVKHGKITH